MQPQWLKWSQHLQAIAQDGLTYTQNSFDRERYAAIREIAAHIVATCTAQDFADVHALLELQEGPATPKVDVRAAIFHEERLLLVKEREDGLWSLPGGWADSQETASEAIAREVLEETGYQVQVTKLLAVYDLSRHEHTPCLYPVYKLFFRCELLSTTPSSLAIDTAGTDFFPQESMPPLSLARVTPGQIAFLFTHLRHPDLPTDFD